MNKTFDKLFLHFDYIKNDDVVTVAAVAFKSELEQTPVLELKKDIETGKNSVKLNNYHYTLLAMDLAMELVISAVDKFDIKEVKLCNQNNLVFDWLSTGNFSEDYSIIFQSIYRNVFKFRDKVEISTAKIEGKNNKVKKILKQKSKSSKPKTSKIDFSFLSELIDEVATTKEENNIVDFPRKVSV